MNTCPTPVSAYPGITIGHGSGGRLTQNLIRKMILPAFRNPFLETLHDGAILPVNGSDLAFTTDSYVINPIFFPGGNIGELAVNGTVNDLAMCGAKPLYISVGFIIEEGFSIEELARVIDSMRSAAAIAGVHIVTGDTKVVDKGKGDKIYINTAGIGAIPEGVHIDPASVRPGDRIIINGSIGLHGMAIMSVREGLEFETAILSDTAALNGLVADMLGADPGIHMLRDPTRGGLSGVLAEIAGDANVGIDIEERKIPIGEEVRGACEILGLDPLYVANEGKLVAIVGPERAPAVLQAMRAHPLGREATIIGEVVSAHPGQVNLKTAVGGSRLVDILSGDQLPRIC